MLLLFVRLERSNSGGGYNLSSGRVIWDSLCIGFLFTLTYYLKEDGMWFLLVCLAFPLLYAICSVADYVAFRHKRIIGRMLIAILVPVFIFESLTVVYKSVNDHYFGVYETNMRNSGEPGRFISNIYSIESERRDIDFPAPIDAVQKAYEVSPTFQENSEFYDSIMTSAWVEGDYEKNPPFGDFFSWLIKDAVFDSKVASNWAGY